MREIQWSHCLLMSCVSAHLSPLSYVLRWVSPHCLCNMFRRETSLVYLLPCHCLIPSHDLNVVVISSRVCDRLYGVIPVRLVLVLACPASFIFHHHWRGISLIFSPYAETFVDLIDDWSRRLKLVSPDVYSDSFVTLVSSDNRHL